MSLEELEQIEGRYFLGQLQDLQSEVNAKTEQDEDATELFTEMMNNLILGKFVATKKVVTLHLAYGGPTLDLVATYTEEINQFSPTLPPEHTLEDISLVYGDGTKRKLTFQEQESLEWLGEQLLLESWEN